MSKKKTNGHAVNTAQDLLPPEAQSTRPVSRQVAGSGFDATVSFEQTNANAEAFTAEQIEMLSFRRFNPLATLNAASLTAALDAYLGGYLTPAARLWERLAKQQKTIRNVKGKREEAVALRTRVIERTDDSPAAHDQQAVLEHFYANARAGHALNRNVNGGFSKLVMQMMEARSFGTAAHHLIWTPDSARAFALPSGVKVPSLTAKFEYVPLEFFESRTGELRFLGMTQAFTGEPLDPNAWLITSEESPLMFAACILAYYDKLAHADLLNFSEKFGTPGLVIHTTAQKGTPEGEAAAALTKSLGSNYRGTQFGAAENKVEIVWPSGGTSGTSLPMHTIIEDVKRDLASLFMGADLSTQSRGDSGSTGASVQGDDEENRERADCAWISETLNAAIDPIVIRWYFGDVPILARVSIDAPKNEDRTVLAALTLQAVSMGAKVPIAPVMKRLNVPIAKDDADDADCFTPPAVAAPQGSADNPVGSPRPALAANTRALATNYDDRPGHWVTIEGRHIFIEDGDTRSGKEIMEQDRHDVGRAIAEKTGGTHLLSKHNGQITHPSGGESESYVHVVEHPNPEEAADAMTKLPGVSAKKDRGILGERIVHVSGAGEVHHVFLRTPKEAADLRAHIGAKAAAKAAAKPDTNDAANRAFATNPNPLTKALPDHEFARLTDYNQGMALTELARTHSDIPHAQAVKANALGLPEAGYVKKGDMWVHTGGKATNTAPQNVPPRGADSPALGKLLATARHTFPEALARDWQPLRTALEHVLQSDDAHFLARAELLRHTLSDPAFITQVITSDGSAQALEEILAAAAAQGLAETSNAQRPTPNAQ